jgi:hypothetical protein
MAPEVDKRNDLVLEVFRESGAQNVLNRYIRNPETKVRSPTPSKSPFTYLGNPVLGHRRRNTSRQNLQRR